MSKPNYEQLRKIDTPDFTNREQITINASTPYTVNEDCFLQISIRTYKEGQNVSVYVDEGMLTYFEGPSGSMQIVFPAVPVNKGSVIKAAFAPGPELIIFKIPRKN